MKRLLILAILFTVRLRVRCVIAADRLRIAYSSISGAYTGIWVAHDAGFFAKEGLEDQIIFIPSATQLAQVTVAGDVDIASLGGGPMIAAVLSGADLESVRQQRQQDDLLDPHQARSQKHRRAARQTHRGQPVWLQLRRLGALRLAQIQHRPAERRDPDAVGLHVEHVRRAQIRRHRRPRGFAADSISLGENRLQRARERHRHGFRLSQSGDGGLWRVNPQEARPDRSLHARLRARHASRKNGPRVHDQNLGKIHHGHRPGAARKTYDFYMGKVLERAPYINMQGMQNAIDDLARTLPAAKNAKPEQFVDLRFLDRLEKSGLLKELYK